VQAAHVQPISEICPQHLSSTCGVLWGGCAAAPEVSHSLQLHGYACSCSCPAAAPRFPYPSRNRATFICEKPKEYFVKPPSGNCNETIEPESFCE
jgi:hypothetical protein